VTRRLGFQQAGALTISRTAAASEDTLALLGPMRANSRRSHPVLIDVVRDTVLFFTEEVDRHRLLELTCDGAVLREIEIAQLGPPEYFEFLDDGIMRLHPPSSPHPAGLLRTTDGVLWAVRDEVRRNQRSDSVTVITRIEHSGRRSSGTLNGWYLLADHSDGRLLLIAEAPVSRVLVVGLSELLSTFTRTAH
jgi:hypothetical protein